MDPLHEPRTREPHLNRARWPGDAVSRHRCADQAAPPQATTEGDGGCTDLDRELDGVETGAGGRPAVRRKLVQITGGRQDLLSQLLDRGLSRAELVIADAHRGITAAVRRLLPEAAAVRRALGTERPLEGAPALRGRLAKELSRIFTAPSRDEAKKHLEQLRAGLETQVPEAMDCLLQGFEAATVFYDFPAAHWRRIRSTNGLERLHGEIKRRIRAVRSFPHRASARRLTISVALRVTSIWTDRRYLDMPVFEKHEAKAA